MHTFPDMQRQESDSSDMHVLAAEVCVEGRLYPKGSLSAYPTR